ncbi:MAG: TIGR03960 family B12-binding radical SAM protein, partial [Hungatella sp.]
DRFNRRNDVFCERVYSPWTDLDQIMREQKIPLFALETQDPIKDFDFLGITLQYEMSYTNVLQILDLSQIPLHTADRTEDDPLVIGGGPCAYNPEPLADFFDLFYIGEGETVYDQLLDRYLDNQNQGGSRHDFLEMAAEIPGIYVPQFYEVTYQEDGTIETFLPTNSHAKPVISKELVVDMDSVSYIEKPIVPFIQATQDRVVLEIQRGCIRGCRFCQAGNVYRPLREHSLEYLKDYACKMLTSTGHEEISLSSLSSSDYTHLEGLVNFLIDEFKGKGINIALPSLRIDAFSLDVMSKVQDVRKSSLTFAPEAGSQRLRNVINKGLTEEVILQGAADAFQSGWNRVKLYFMLGLPTETVEDMEGIAELSEKVAEVYYEIPKDQRNGKVQIVASSAFFVPKPFTPFQWARMCTKEEFLERAYLVKNKFKQMRNTKSLKYNWHEADLTILEGVLARGDRKTGALIEEAYKNGALFDAWSEHFHNEIWMQAFQTCDIDSDFYTVRERSLDEIFPWDFIDAGVSKEFLKREWKESQTETETPNCRQRCSACGAKKYKGGVCYEDKN